MIQLHILINSAGHFLFFFYNSQTLLTFSKLYPLALQLHFQVTGFFHDCSLLKKDHLLFHSHPYCQSHFALSFYFYPSVPSNNSFSSHFLIFQISSLQRSLQLQLLSNTPSFWVQLFLRCPKIPLTDISYL